MASLKELRKKLDDAKSSKARIEGALSVHMKKLKEEFGFDSVEEANKELTVYNKKIEKLKKDYDKTLEEIHKKYDL